MVVFESERQFETRRLKLVRCNHVAVSLVHWAWKEGVRENVQEGMRINSGLAAKSKGFGQTFDHSRDDEIPSQLDRVGSVSFLARHEGLLPNRVEEWLASFDRFRRATGNNEQLPGVGDIRSPEDCRSNIVLLSFPVCFGQTARQAHADGAHGNMNGAGG